MTHTNETMRQRAQAMFDSGELCLIKKEFKGFCEQMLHSLILQEIFNSNVFCLKSGLDGDEDDTPEERGEVALQQAKEIQATIRDYQIALGVLDGSIPVWRDASKYITQTD